MPSVEVIINKKNGRAIIKGEGFQVAALKKKLEEMGLVVERHEGHPHVHDHDHQGTHDHQHR